MERQLWLKSSLPLLSWKQAKPSTTVEILMSCPIQGDGVTDYYAQGPTFDPTNLLDPNETVNLKDKGALKGTDLADLCTLVGGAGS